MAVQVFPLLLVGGTLYYSSASIAYDGQDPVKVW
jgi:hypothetical protein